MTEVLKVVTTVFLSLRYVISVSSFYLQCILTSENLVQSLFPMLMKAVEKNKAVLAVKFLGKAGVWIKEIISEVNGIVEK